MMLFDLGFGSDKMDYVNENVEDLKLNGEIIVMTGFRYKNLNAMIKDLGGEVGDNINKKTTIVLAKNISSGSSKIAKAQKLGIKVMTLKNLFKVLIKNIN